ncbi:MAG: hypothetical protein ACKO0Z_22360 [Betaproteobacteria bacterium]
MILALDLASVTGWAIGDESSTKQSGITKLSRKVGFSEDGSRYLSLRTFLMAKRAEYETFEAIFYEQVQRHVSTYSAQMYGGFKAVTLVFAEQSKIPVYGFGVGEIKKHATGSGVASKDQMMGWARESGYSPADHNEADALAILSLARNRFYDSVDRGRPSLAIHGYVVQ